MANAGYPTPAAHPSLDELLADVRSEEVVAHLAACPRCRVDARLAQEALGADPAALPDIGRARNQMAEARALATLSWSDSLTASPPADGPVWVDELRVGQAVDGYVVEAYLGRGSAGSVYRVRREADARIFALKALSSTSTPALRRMKREADAQGRLDHPNIVHVYDMVDVMETTGLVLEFVDGPTLGQWLADAGRASIGVADTLCDGIVAGLQAAHASGRVHRDLKPGNILLASGDGEAWVPKIADFGLVRSVIHDVESSWETRPGVPLGTPAYMAPEQTRDAHGAGVQSDVFSLGAVMYEVVTGERAFPGTRLEAYERAQKGRFLLPDDHVPELPHRMVRAICGALRPELEHRLPDCSSFLAVWRGGDRPW